MQIDFATRIALNELSECDTPLDATNYFKANQNILKDWRYIYACEDSKGTLKLENQLFENKAVVISAFKGKSLWIIDEKILGNPGDVGYLVGKGIYLDSNIASFIHSLAYKENISSKLQGHLNVLQSLKIDYANLNPSFYLWEAQRQFEKSPQSLELCKKTFAAVNCLPLINKPLNSEWGQLYRQYYQEQAEAAITPFFNHLIYQLNTGLSEQLNYESGIIEALLLKTKILEYSSKKSSQYKIDQLIRFMDETLKLLLTRELSLLADILLHKHQSTLSQKLNSLQNQEDPLALIKNCAWDIYIFRMIDMLADVELNPKPDFYLTEILAFDKDIWGIYNLSALKGIAINTKNGMKYPFPSKNIDIWLMEHLGEKKAMQLHDVTSFEAICNRSKYRQKIEINEMLKELRNELLMVLKRQ